MENNIPEFKLIIVGDSGVGKTSLINKFSSQIIKNIVPMDGVNIYNLEFNTSKGNIKLNIWESVNKDSADTLSDGF